MGDVDRYRDRAAEMRGCARSAATAELSKIYQELALRWEALADFAAASDGRLQEMGSSAVQLGELGSLRLDGPVRD
jgi:hypothetical protein